MIELFVCAIKRNCLRKYLSMGDLGLRKKQRWKKGKKIWAYLKT